MVLCPCGTNAHFGYKGGSPNHCSKCKLPEMIHIHARRCEHLDCKIEAMFNFRGLKDRRFCMSHAEPEMINVVCRRCLHPDCDKYASYCFPDSNKRIYCSKHSKSGMVNRCWELCKIRRRIAGKASIRSQHKEIYFTGVQLNPDGSVKSWGTKNG